jgi:glycine/D-amino acid oxidase-like deaminating enzyme
MQSHVNVAVLGSGVSGVSIAAHLAMRGMRHVLLLEAHEIGSQTRSQAADLMPLLHATALLTEMLRDSLTVCATFTGDIGHNMQFHHMGWLQIRAEC